MGCVKLIRENEFDRKSNKKLAKTVPFFNLFSNFAL